MDLNPSVKVSVIIPFYNNKDWLFDAVESVLSQTFVNFEIIVVNDGSVENVEDFLLEYGDKIIYRYKENGGPASARNLAIKIATGEFIAFLDSDDVWLPEKTFKQLSFMMKTDAQWSHTGFFNWYPERNKTVLKHNSDDYGNVYLKSFISLRANTPAIIIRKKCFEQHPEFIFTEKMRIAEDSTLWSRIAKYYPLALIEEPLIKVRQRGTNSDLSSLLRFRSKAQIYEEIRLGKFSDLTFLIVFIYKLYYTGETLIKYFENNTNINKVTLERLGKVLWVLPFVIERLYLPFLKRYKIDKYRLSYRK